MMSKRDSEVCVCTLTSRLQQEIMICICCDPCWLHQSQLSLVPSQSNTKFFFFYLFFNLLGHEVSSKTVYGITGRIRRDGICTEMTGRSRCREESPTDSWPGLWMTPLHSWSHSSGVSPSALLSCICTT